MHSTFIKKTFKSFSIYAGTNFISLVVPLFMLPILTRFLSPKDYGVLATFMAASGIVTAIISMGVKEPVMRGYFDREKENFAFPEFVFNALFINFAMFLILTGILFSSGSHISQKLSIPFAWLFLLPAIGICLAIQRIPFRLFVFKQQPLPHAALKVSKTFIEILLSTFFVVFLGLRWQGRVLGLFINTILFCVIGIIFLFKYNLLRFSINYQYLRNILHYGAPLLLHSLGVSVIAATDRFFLNRLEGVSITGVYSVGYSVSTAIALLAGAFLFVWKPIVYKKLNKATFELKTKLVKATYLYFVSIVLITIIFILSAPLFLKFLVGPAFYDASTFIRWIASGYAVHGMFAMVAIYMYYAKKTYFLIIVAIIAVIFNIILNYTLIKLNGAVGAAQATFLTFVMKFLLVWYFSNKAYPMPWFSLIKFKKIGLISRN